MLLKECAFEVKIPDEDGVYGVKVKFDSGGIGMRHMKLKSCRFLNSSTV